MVSIDFRAPGFVGLRSYPKAIAHKTSRFPAPCQFTSRESYSWNEGRDWTVVRCIGVILDWTRTRFRGSSKTWKRTISGWILLPLWPRWPARMPWRKSATLSRTSGWEWVKNCIFQDKWPASINHTNEDRGGFSKLLGIYYKLVFFPKMFNCFLSPERVLVARHPDLPSLVLFTLMKEIGMFAKVLEIDHRLVVLLHC